MEFGLISLTFHQQRHERYHRRAHFADGQAVNAVVARGIHHRLEVCVHLPKFTRQFLHAHAAWHERIRGVTVSRNRAIQIDTYLLIYLLTYSVARRSSWHWCRHQLRDEELIAGWSKKVSRIRNKSYCIVRKPANCDCVGGDYMVGTVERLKEHQHIRTVNTESMIATKTTLLLEKCQTPSKTQTDKQTCPFVDCVCQGRPAPLIRSRHMAL